MAKPLPPACWLFHDGAAGNRRQASALAEALELPFTEMVLRPRALARWLAPRRAGSPAMAFGTEFADLLRQQAPALVIGCGRLAALATRHARGAGATAIQILDPRINPRHWDLVIAPQHDQLHGDNVIGLLGSLNPVDADWLRLARAEYRELAALAGPRTALLLGGPTGATRFDDQALERTLDALDAVLARDGGSLMLCGSRRTPARWAARLRARYPAGRHLCWLDAQDGRNPYPGVLAWADRIVVSPDSSNLLSEAGATGAPVYVAEPGCASGRARSFINALLASGRVREFNATPEPFDPTPLRETARVAALVRERLSRD